MARYPYRIYFISGFDENIVGLGSFWPSVVRFAYILNTQLSTRGITEYCHRILYASRFDEIKSVLYADNSTVYIYVNNGGLIIILHYNNLPDEWIRYILCLFLCLIHINLFNVWSINLKNIVINVKHKKIFMD